MRHLCAWLGHVTTNQPAAGPFPLVWQLGTVWHWLAMWGHALCADADRLQPMLLRHAAPPTHRIMPRASQVLALSLRRPVDRGYVVDWSLQREILAR